MYNNIISCVYVHVHVDVHVDVHVYVNIHVDVHVNLHGCTVQLMRNLTFSQEYKRYCSRVRALSLSVNTTHTRE